jgi:hypothetical protein
MFKAFEEHNDKSITLLLRNGRRRKETSGGEASGVTLHRITLFDFGPLR